MTVSAEGFSSEAQYTTRPRIDPSGKTTRAFRPGPVRAGTWAAELGVAGVAPRALGDLDGKVAWRVEIELSDAPAFADEPYRTGRPGRRRTGTIGRGRVRMSGGSRRVRVRLDPGGRTLLRRRGVRARLVFTATDGDGATAQATRRVRLLRRR